MPIFTGFIRNLHGTYANEERRSVNVRELCNLCGWNSIDRYLLKLYNILERACCYFDFEEKGTSTSCNPVYTRNIPGHDKRS